MVSSKDVAKKAGVSQSTVSRVINNPDSVRSEKKEIVRKVMEDLNYRPNSIARSLLSNKTNQISLISGTLSNPFFVETTQKIVNYAYKKGFTVNVYFEEDFEHNSLYSNVFSQKTEGIILSSMYYDSPHFKELERLGVPYIMFNRKHSNGGNFVELDNFQAGKKAGNHFISKGHRNIHWIGGELEKSTFLGRLEGFKESMEQNNISIDPCKFSITPQNPEAIDNAIYSILALREKPTAIFATTDMIALRVVNILKREGYRIPEDFALIAVDNTYLVQHSAFNLTSIGIEGDENLGEVAIRHLINMIDGIAEKNIQKTLPCELFERGTT